MKESKTKHSLGNCIGFSNDKVLRSTLAMISIKNNKCKQKLKKKWSSQSGSFEIKNERNNQQFESRLSQKLSHHSHQTI